MQKTSVFLFLGGPGSGKGTQIKLLAEKFGFSHIISSQLGKNYIQTHNDPHTLKQKEIYAKGLLFDPRWMFERVKEKTEELLSNKSCKGIVYDGSPRTLYEAKTLYKFLLENVGKENIKIIEIDVSEDELRSRTEKRLICSESNKHIFIRSDKLQAGVSCPEGDGILIVRDLDNPEVFRVRMIAYREQTVPGLNYLRKNHKVITINGEQGIEKIHKDIISSLKL